MNCDLKTLHELENELHVELLPGTELMTDVGSHHFVKAAGSSSRVLVPQPSDDPHDPLVGSTCLWLNHSPNTYPSFGLIELVASMEGCHFGKRPAFYFCTRIWSIGPRSYVRGLHCGFRIKLD